MRAERSSVLVSVAGVLLLVGLALALVWLTRAGLAPTTAPFAGDDPATEGEDPPYGGPPGLLDPVAEGAELPGGFRQVIGRDGIRPIYDPSYIRGREADWDADTLVIGVAIDGDARAYPISVLNTREIVNSEAAGVPYLASW